MDEPQLRLENVKVKQIIEDCRSGRIMIPEFQREYIWQRSRAPKLIDSLYRKYPISSLLLWQSAEYITARNKEPRPARTSIISWLIDGQQRMTTLSRILSGDEGIEVVFHPENDEFRLANAATKKDNNWIRVADLWDDQRYRQIRRNLDTKYNQDKREIQFEKVRKILDYDIPLITMNGHSFNDAVDVFIRINTSVVRLKVENIESAKIAAKHTSFIAKEVVPFLDRLRQHGFNRLNVMHLFRACAFIAHPDGRSRIPLHELKTDEVREAWKRTKNATEKAINLLRSELGLLNMEILWSGALLVPLIVLCDAMPPRERDSHGLVAWLALAALHHRYSVATETALDQDLLACRNSDPIGALLANLRKERSSLLAIANDFRGSLNDKNGIFAAYVACKHRGLLDFYTGGKILLQSSVDRHHILPRAQFVENLRSKSDIIANIAFISGDVNKAINSSGPEVYLKQISRKTLSSQCIPDDQKLWFIDCAEKFWKARRFLLAESFNDFLKKALPNRRLG